MDTKSQPGALSIIALVKQVPDVERVRFDRETGRLDRASAEAMINPFDLNALEAAVLVKERVGGTVTTISMGPPQAKSALRDTLARGADRAILLTDARFAGADTLATSYTLASAIKKLGRFDLIICGEKTVDGDTAQVGPEVAEHLDIPHIGYVDEIKGVTRNGIIVKSKIGRDYRLMELKFPGLITVTKNVNVPRLPTLRDKLRARRARIETWSADDLADVADADRFGLSGSPTMVVKVYTPPVGGRKGIVIRGSPREAARRLMAILESMGVLR